MAKTGYVYIMSNQKNGTLYVGVTSDLVKRVHQHKQKLVEGFSKKYELGLLVYYEVHDSIETAIAYEKKLKNRNRAWKMSLIEGMNPEWKDLASEIA